MASVSRLVSTAAMIDFATARPAVPETLDCSGEAGGGTVTCDTAGVWSGDGLAWYSYSVFVVSLLWFYDWMRFVCVKGTRFCRVSRPFSCSPFYTYYLHFCQDEIGVVMHCESNRGRIRTKPGLSGFKLFL